jgi:hypothetical protein
MRCSRCQTPYKPGRTFCTVCGYAAKVPEYFSAGQISAARDKFSRQKLFKTNATSKGVRTAKTLLRAYVLGTSLAMAVMAAVLIGLVMHAHHASQIEQGKRPASDGITPPQQIKVQSDELKSALPVVSSANPQEMSSDDVVPVQSAALTSSHSEPVADNSSDSMPQPDAQTASIMYAEFSAPTITSHNISVIPGPSFAYYKAFGGSWRITSPGGGFTGTFNVLVPGQYDLVVTHLTSSADACPENGSSPVTIRLNSEVIAGNYDPAAHHVGNHDWATDRWTIEANPGQYILSWTAGALCSHYWIRRIELLPKSAQ